MSNSGSSYSAHACLRRSRVTAVESEQGVGLHEAAKQPRASRGVVWKFLRGQGRFFEKEPLIIIP